MSSRMPWECRRPHRGRGGYRQLSRLCEVKKTNVPVVEVIYGGLAATVESYVYDMRNKLHDKYEESVTAPEREELTVKLQEAEDWLYEDGEDETEGVYIVKLEELKKIVQCKAHILELNMHADAQAREYKQKDPLGVGGLFVDLKLRVVWVFEGFKMFLLQLGLNYFGGSRLLALIKGIMREQRVHVRDQ